MDSQTLLIVDGLFRFSAFSFFILLGALLVRDIENRQVALLGLWASLSGAAYLVCTGPIFHRLFGDGMAIVELFCNTGQIAIWLFSLSQFKDKFRIEPWHIVVGLTFYVIGRIYFVWFQGDEGLVALSLTAAYATMRFGLILHMLYVAWAGRGDDLIEARRRFRLVYIAAVSLTVFLIALGETAFDQSSFGPAILFWQAAGMWLLASVLVWHVVILKTSVIFDGDASRRPTAKARPSDPSEGHDLATVERLINQEKLFLRAGLTIANLANEAGLPEHRLRRLINTHLGYRNFADFLNHYRIDAAKERLSSVDDRNIPVLTIAMDLGYGSLGPFNRAFKERTGLTPTEFRKKRLADC